MHTHTHTHTHTGVMVRPPNNTKEYECVLTNKLRQDHDSHVLVTVILALVVFAIGGYTFKFFLVAFFVKVHKECGNLPREEEEKSMRRSKRRTGTS